VKRRAAVVLASLLLAGLGACSSDQSPGITPEGTTNDGPSTTSHTLPRCDPTPGAKVPVGGCIDEDGAVVNPDDAP
jgi:hypothetical protein